MCNQNYLKFYIKIQSIAHFLPVPIKNPAFFGFNFEQSFHQQKMVKFGVLQKVEYFIEFLSRL